jgi:hypothetical protein
MTWLLLAAWILASFLLAPIVGRYLKGRDMASTQSTVEDEHREQLLRSIGNVRPPRFSPESESFAERWFRHYLPRSGDGCPVCQTWPSAIEAAADPSLDTFCFYGRYLRDAWLEEVALEKQRAARTMKGPKANVSASAPHISETTGGAP